MSFFSFHVALDYLSKGCDVFRESWQGTRFLRMVDGTIMWFYSNGASRPVSVHEGLSSGHVQAEDWTYRCPGHKWQYHDCGDLRQCEFCEIDEMGDFRNETIAYFRELGKDPPALGAYDVVTDDMYDAMKRQKLIKDIAFAININSAENVSNTPDFLLASMLVGCLESFNQHVNARDSWYGIKPAIMWDGMSDAFRAELAAAIREIGVDIPPADDPDAHETPITFDGHLKDSRHLPLFTAFMYRHFVYGDRVMHE